MQLQQVLSFDLFIEQNEPKAGSRYSSCEHCSLWVWTRKKEGKIEGLQERIDQGSTR